MGTAAAVIVCLVAATGGGSGVTAGTDKIDPPVLDAMRDGERVPVLILLRTQLLLGPEAFEAFIAANANRYASSPEQMA